MRFQRNEGDKSPMSERCVRLGKNGRRSGDEEVGRMTEMYVDK